MPPDVDTEVCVVGAGMAGLACALDLQAAGLEVTVLEAEDRAGGRVGGPPSGQEDLVVDRGFQILLTDYPDFQRRVDPVLASHRRSRCPLWTGPFGSVVRSASGEPVRMRVEPISWFRAAP